MAERGRPRRDDTERPHCPWPGRKRRDVRHRGLVKAKDGTVTRRRYLCSPGTPKEHSFSVPEDPDGTHQPTFAGCRGRPPMRFATA